VSDFFVFAEEDFRGETFPADSASSCISGISLSIQNI